MPRVKGTWPRTKVVDEPERLKCSGCRKYECVCPSRIGVSVVREHIEALRPFMDDEQALSVLDVVLDLPILKEDHATEKKGIAQALWNGYSGYVLRTCMSLHHCSVCEEDIKLGQRYFDGGHKHRAHWRCVNRRGPERRKGGMYS